MGTSTCSHIQLAYEAKPLSESTLEGLTSIGAKKIRFRILSHDPRNIDEFRKNWNKDKKLVFHEPDAVEETFLHRIGRYPLLENVLKSIPVLDEKRIPTNGIVKALCHYPRMYSSEVSADETCGILVDSRNDRHLLHELLSFGINTPKGSERFFQGGLNSFLTGYLTASFDKETGTGEFDLALFAKSGAFVDYRTHVPLSSEASVSRVLALFYDVLPFRIRDLTQARATVTTFEQRQYRNSKWTDTPVAPWKITPDMIADASPEEVQAVAEHNFFVSDRLHSNTFLSSTGDNCAGGVCEATFTFAETMKRFFLETLAEDAHSVYTCRWSGDKFTWAMRNLGISSHHRRMDINNAGRYVERSPKKFCSYVSEEDIPLLRDNIGDELSKVFERTKNSGKHVCRSSKLTLNVPIFKNTNACWYLLCYLCYASWANAATRELRLPRSSDSQWIND